MSGREFLLGTIAGLVVNEFCDVSPWLAAKLASWSAHARYADPERAAVRAEELRAVVHDRPGKLFKLLTASGFAFASCVASIRRVCSAPTRAPGDRATQQRRSSRDDLPSDVAVPYLLPTERFRGEWRRHWVHHLPELLFIVVTTTGCGYLCAFAVQHAQASLAGLAVALWVGALLVAVWRCVVWHRSRVLFTTDRVVVIVGVVRRRVDVFPLGSTRMQVLQSHTGRFLDYGTFAFEELGSASPSKVMVRNMPRPRWIASHLAKP